MIQLLRFTSSIERMLGGSTANIKGCIAASLSEPANGPVVEHCLAAMSGIPDAARGAAIPQSLRSRITPALAGGLSDALCVARVRPDSLLSGGLKCRERPVR